MRKIFNKINNMNNTRRGVFEVCLAVASFAIGGLVMLKCLKENKNG